MTFSGQFVDTEFHDWTSLSTTHVPRASSSNKTGPQGEQNASWLWQPEASRILQRLAGNVCFQAVWKESKYLFRRFTPESCHGIWKWTSSYKEFVLKSRFFRQQFRDPKFIEILIRQQHSFTNLSGLQEWTVKSAKILEPRFSDFTTDSQSGANLNSTMETTILLYFTLPCSVFLRKEVSQTCTD